MTLRTLTALLSTGALALSLAACGETDKEDTGDEDVDNALGVTRLEQPQQRLRHDHVTDP